MNCRREHASFFFFPTIFFCCCCFFVFLLFFSFFLFFIYASPIRSYAISLLLFRFVSLSYESVREPVPGVTKRMRSEKRQLLCDELADRLLLFSFLAVDLSTSFVLVRQSIREAVSSLAFDEIMSENQKSMLINEEKGKRKKKKLKEI